ncbi:protein transport protein bet1 [Recurvomyces mirabilis]|nr:protein transport protein bet1 [Recurvomyces mirabilis]
MASRFQRDSRNALFSSYDAQTRSRPSSAAPGAAPRTASRNQPYSTNHANNSSPYSLGGYGDDSGQLSAQSSSGPGFSAYPGSNGDVAGRRSGDGGFRPATPNKKGQYSDAVIDELESQNDDQVGEMSKKVRMLKDLTVAIGDEIRDSTAFAEKMNDGFESTRNRLRGTMNRMLRMAERTGVGWRIWLGFFVFIFLLFAYVWLF